MFDTASDEHQKTVHESWKPRTRRVPADGAEVQDSRTPVYDLHFDFELMDFVLSPVSATVEDVVSRGVASRSVEDASRDNVGFGTASQQPTPRTANDIPPPSSETAPPSPDVLLRGDSAHDSVEPCASSRRSAPPRLTTRKAPSPLSGEGVSGEGAPALLASAVLQEEGQLATAVLQEEGQLATRRLRLFRFAELTGLERKLPPELLERVLHEELFLQNRNVASFGYVANVLKGELPPEKVQMH